MGCKAVVHAARLYNMSPSQVLLKLDFKNTFNCFRRDKMLMAVAEHTPELFDFIYSAYAPSSSLFCKDQIIQSSEGVQKGDTSAPLLFCITIHPMILKL